MNRKQILEKCRDILEMSDGEVRMFEAIVETSSAPVHLKRVFMRAIDLRMDRIRILESDVYIVNGDIDDMT